MNRLRNSDLAIEETLSVKDAAIVIGINVLLVQRYVKTYNNDPQKLFQGTCHKSRERPCIRLTDGYSKFLLGYIVKNPTAVLDELKLKLRGQFEGLKISILAVHSNLVNNAHITLKNSKG